MSATAPVNLFSATVGCNLVLRVEYVEQYWLSNQRFSMIASGTERKKVFGARCAELFKGGREDPKMNEERNGQANVTTIELSSSAECAASCSVCNTQLPPQEGSGLCSNPDCP